MKTYLTLGIAAAMALGFAACSSEDVPQPTQEQEKGNGAYVQLTFQFNDETTSRAASAETSEVYAEGESYEYNIKKVYLYFFEKNESGTFEPVKLSEVSGHQYYYEYDVNKESLRQSTAEADNPTGTSTTAGSSSKAVVYKTSSVELPAKIEVDHTYHVYALTNKPYTGTISSEDAFLESELAVDEDTDITCEVDANGLKSVTDAQIPMAARSYNGKVYAEMTPTKANTVGSPYQLSFELERSYARITYMNETTSFDLYQTNASETKIGKVELIGYQVVNRAKNFFTYRHVGDISTAATPYKISYQTDATKKFGPIDANSPYVIDPNTKNKQKNTLFTDFNGLFSDAQAVISYDNISSTANLQKNTQFSVLQPATGSKPKTIEYVAENTMEKDAQIKGQTTGVIFLARFSFTDEQKDQSSENKTLVDKNNSWVPGNNLYYYEGKFYASLADLQTVNSHIDATNYKSYGVKFFKNGIGYYEYFIRHYDNGNNSEMGVMEFAIVRNNSYELMVNKISMAPYTGLPGGPEDPDNPDPDTPDPDDPDESLTIYMQMTVKVRPWIVRTISVNLGQ